MVNKRLLQKMLGFTLTVLLLAGCRGAPGNISGKMIYENLTNGGSTKPMANVMIVLCRVSSDGLPDGPVVAASNKGEIEHICTLQGGATTLTDTDGTFTLNDVPPAIYLVMFHLFPAELDKQGVEWNDIALTEASWNDVDGVEPSVASGFWEDGGKAFALSDWNSRDGTTVTKGNVCSNKFGFCFSILEGGPYPVIEVKSDETIKVELTAHFTPKE